MKKALQNEKDSLLIMKDTANMRAQSRVMSLYGRYTLKKRYFLLLLFRMIMHREKRHAQIFYNFIIMRVPLLEVLSGEFTIFFRLSPMLSQTEQK
jgi:hypothetical protein